MRVFINGCYVYWYLYLFFVFCFFSVTRYLVNGSDLVKRSNAPNSGKYLRRVTRALLNTYTKPRKKLKTTYISEPGERASALYTHQQRQ